MGLLRESDNAFYQQSVGPDNDVLSPTALEVASCDSKGVTMLKKGLREATRKVAEQAQTQTKRTDPMAPRKQRKHDKRMAIVTANWEQERQPRTAEQILANLDRQPGAKKPRGLVRTKSESVPVSRRAKRKGSRRCLTKLNGATRNINAPPSC